MGRAGRSIVLATADPSPTPVRRNIASTDDTSPFALRTKRVAVKTSDRVGELPSEAGPRRTTM